MSRGTITRAGQKRFCGESKSEDSGLGEKGVKTQGEEEDVTYLQKGKSEDCGFGEKSVETQQEEEEVSSLQKGKSEDSDLGEKSVPTPRENEEERFSEKVNSGDSGSYEWGSMHTDEVEPEDMDVTVPVDDQDIQLPCLDRCSKFLWFHHFKFVLGGGYP
ncbi:uncharacterized protein LOC120433055 isoform X1 [Oreochromis aureus]|uniref:uncharacterized protein LOC120433055 isoform X1 n=1 Tax=Oreochromis aureus TaxID=47969 RepID=UPI001953B7B8|nr:uncharacterized protein LOC120433055 isoform X1 [Oreochromis aureus]